ncbi:MAG: GTPase domain-containing protein [Polyangiaceae bacterium]|nr:GTPase domain-containing protein [Polyangiaceae bacterium]
MATIHHGRKEVLLKLVYYGPGLGGKTTNLEHIHRHSRPEYRGKLLSLTTESERTIFFDLLPVHLGKFMGYTIRLHLCTVPGQIAYDDTRRVILRNVDGVVFVVDSQPDALEANIQSMQNLEINLERQGMEFSRVPMVVQYNKRDLEGVLPTATLRRELGLPRDLKEHEAVARTGQGVFDTLKSVVRECLRLVGDPSRAAEGRTPSILPGRRASSFPGASPRAAEQTQRPPKPEP